MFWLILVALQIARAKWLVNLGSRSDMICLGILNQGNRCNRYNAATPCPSMVLLQGINFAALEHP